MIALKTLVEKLDVVSADGLLEEEVSEVVYDSRKVTKDCMFICIVGTNVDGHDFIEQAIDRGAKVVVVSRFLEILKGKKVITVKVEDTRHAMALIASSYYGNPAEKMKMVGITGTKGKTTTAYLMKSILEAAGHKVGLVGTIETIIGEEKIPSQNTTPESLLLQGYFRKMADAGCDIVVMEVSSQGLMMHRTQGFVFDIGILTNLEPDHIGPNEHGSFEEYAACKGMLFKQCHVGIVNQDDVHTQTVIDGHTCTIETYGFGEGADFRASHTKLVTKPGSLGVSFEVTGKINLKAEISTPGKFSVYNALTAIAVCQHFLVDENCMKEALQKAKVKGRIEMVNVSKDFTLMIDYAHNAMALESLLTTLKEYRPNRLICLFGCGGNRSKLRRYEMGEVSGKIADITIITSDNPRFEDPQDIINDIKLGIAKTNGVFVEIGDRRAAIAYAIQKGQPGDIIVLAGKGHEDYQEIHGVHYPMDERIIIQQILSERELL